jgi:hypothetical protein
MDKSQVVSIGTFAGGSFGCDGDPSKVYEYFAVAGDRDSQGFPRFASRHRLAVEKYARQLDAAKVAVPRGRTPYLRKIIQGIASAAESAAGRNDRKEESRLRDLAEKLSIWPSHEPLPHGVEKYAV